RLALLIYRRHNNAGSLEYRIIPCEEIVRLPIRVRVLLGQLVKKVKLEALVMEAPRQSDISLNRYGPADQRFSSYLLALGKREPLQLMSDADQFVPKLDKPSDCFFDLL